MAFEYDQLEDEIVARLTPALDGAAKVAPLPESDKAIKGAVDDAVGDNKTLVLVCYTGSDFGPAMTVGVMKQEEGVNLLLNLQSNKTRGDAGIYKTIRLIKKSLMGYKSQHGGRLKLKTIDFDDRDEKMAMFSYNVVFTVTVDQVQEKPDGDEDITGKPTLTSTTFNDKYE